MTEGQGETTVVETPPETPPVENSTPIDAQGNFSEGWMNLIDEDIRGEQSLQKYTNFGAMAKSLVHAQRMVGADKMVVPNENTSESEWNEVYDRLGRPKTTDDYSVEIEEELQPYFKPERVTEARELFYKAGLNQKQADELIAFQKKMVAEDLQEFERSQLAARQEAEETLKRKWGAAYQERLHAANRMIADNADEGTKEKILSMAGNSPEFADFLANIATKFMESGVITDLSSTQPTPDQLETEKKQLMHSDAYTNPQNPDNKRTVERVTKIFQMQAAARGEG
jgi:hypothetical protein